MVSHLLKNKHLINRAGFGLSLNQLKTCAQDNWKDIWNSYAAQRPFKPIDYETPAPDFSYNSSSKLNAAQRKELQKSNRQRNIEINLAFLQQMVHSEDQLREKMAFFWHGHFATRAVNPKLGRQLLNEIRKNALGNFKDLLFAVSKAPAMLSFLNNQQNKKGHPNENFAREVMELFTMGRGNYTEKDIREGARAFTGWGYNKEALFLERKRLHDSGTKTFLGKTGNFDGNDILNIILEQKATAKFITTKLYRFLVNEQVNEAHIDVLSRRFYASGYDIRSFLEDIFTSGWFYDKAHIGNKIKSPVELMAGIMRILPMQITVPENLIIYQKLLGQMLLYPPNVAGWPSGKAWVDSSTLLLRMQLPQIWSGLRPLDLTPDVDDDLEMGLKRKRSLAKSFKNPHITIQWPDIEAAFAGKDVASVLLQQQSSAAAEQLKLKPHESEQIRMRIIEVMSTPEYQLC